MRILILFLFISLTIGGNAAEMLSGTTSAYGAACDLARSFIQTDSALFKAVCMKPQKPEYIAFMDNMVEQIEQQSKLPMSQRTGPKSIVKVYEFAHLSKNGPNSYAHILGIDEIGFVDIEAELMNGQLFHNRTFVYRIKDRWKTLPFPSAYPLLTAGLNGEPRPKTLVYSSASGAVTVSTTQAARHRLP